MRAIFFDLNIPKVLATKGLKSVWPGVVWSPLSATRFADLPEPPLPGPRGVRVRNRQCGICATDLTVLNVEADPRVSLAALPGLSRIYLGHEVVSDVVEVGPDVTTLQPGDRVVMDTRYHGPNCRTQEIEPPCPQCANGQWCLCENQSLGRGEPGTGGGWGDGYTAHETEVYRIPPELSDDQAVLVEPYSVVLHAVLRRVPQPGEHVLVLGCGIIGLLTLVVLRVVAPQAQVIAMARHPHQAEMAQKLGADVVVRNEDGYAATARLTNARLYNGQLGNRTLLGGFDLVYDTVGSARTIQDCLRWVRAQGAVMIVGISPTLMHLDLSPVWHQEVDLIGSVGHGEEVWEGQRRHAYDWICRWMLERKLPVEELITHRYPLEEYRAAIRVAQARSLERSIKVMLTMQAG